MANKITEILKTKYPVIQGGMVWNSGWRLAAAVSNSGGLGLIGSGSMYPDVLEEHVKKCQQATDKPFGVNLPMLYPDIDKHIETIQKYKVPVVFTSAGNPKIWTETLKNEGITVVHVVSSVKFALKAQDAGVDAVVAEGFEAGGHNGRDETTTLCLIPNVKKHVNIPLIAAGGIATGSQIVAAMVLGADGVQLGSRFAATFEASSHETYKNILVNAGEGDTVLTLKELAPVRIIKTEFYHELVNAYENCASKEELAKLLGRARPKKGMFEGDLISGEFQAGQSSALIDEIKTVQQVFDDLLAEIRDLKFDFMKVFTES